MNKLSTFLAFDVRAGAITHDRLSEIALVLVKEGEIYDKIFIEVDSPEAKALDSSCTSLKDAWRDIEPFFDQVEYVTAFNLSVHISNLEKSLAVYNIPLPKKKFVCVYNWYKVANPSETNLDYYQITDTLQLDLVADTSQHLSQAINAANIAIYLEKNSGQTIAQRYKFINDKTANFFKRSTESADLTGVDWFDTTHSDTTLFNGQTVVITGNFDKHPNRDELAQLIESYGAKVASGISGKTTMVLAGEGAGPSKINKVRELRDKGKSIILLSESGLDSLIN